MYAVALLLHSVVRWVVLLALLGRFGRALQGVAGAPWGKVDRALGGATTGLLHLQLLLGVGLYFTSPIVDGALGDFGGAMKDSLLRFWLVEHGSMMVIAVVIAQVASSVAKRRGDSDSRVAHRIAAVGSGLALVLILAAIPWPFRAVVGRPLLP